MSCEDKAIISTKITPVRNRKIYYIAQQKKTSMKRLFLLAIASTVFFSCSEETKVVNPDTVIKGKITNADGNTAWLETFKNEKTEANIGANGEFEIKIALTQAACFDLVNGKARTYLCLSPGDTVNVSFDAKDITGTVKYDGKDAAFPNYLAEKKRTINQLMIGEYDSLYVLNTDTFLLTAKTLITKLKTSYDAIKLDTSIDKTILSWEESAINFDETALILDYPYYSKMMKGIDSVPGLDKILAATNNLSLVDSKSLQLESYRNVLNSYINLKFEDELLADTTLKANSEGKEKAKWLAIEKNITDPSVKEYLEFNFITKNSALSFVAAEKEKLKASTKDTVYQKQLK